MVLVGEGSDEVFGGYPDLAHLLNSASPRWALLQRLPRLRARGAASRPAAGAPAGRVDVLRRAADGQPLYRGLDVVFFDREKDAAATTEARARRAMPASQSRRHGRAALRRVLRRASPHADFAQQMSYVELRNRLPELLLMRVDKFSMAHSLEARAPFLDHEPGRATRCRCPRR